MAETSLRDSMCGCYRLSRRKQVVEEYFDCGSDEPDWNPRYNIAPTQPVPVIRQNPKEPVRELSLVQAAELPRVPDREITPAPRKCSKRRILGHSAQATSLLPIAGTTKCSHIARGFSCGNGTASVAELTPRHSDYRERGTKLPANGGEKWRRKQLLICCRNSQRLNKSCFRTSKTDTSLK